MRPNSSFQHEGLFFSPLKKKDLQKDNPHTRAVRAVQLDRPSLVCAKRQRQEPLGCFQLLQAAKVVGLPITNLL